MILITDSNILYSALFKPSGNIAKILKTEKSIQFYAPDFLMEEVSRYLDEIIKGSTENKQTILKDFKEYQSRIQIISVSEIPRQKIEHSIEIVRDIDIDDFPFVALHLHTGHKIWTVDRKLTNGLKRKGYDICVNTSQLLEYRYKK